MGTVTPDPVTPDPVTPDPVTPDPVTPDPVTPDPVTPDEEDAPDPIKLSSDTAGDAVQVTINATAGTPLSSATDIVVDLKSLAYRPASPKIPSTSIPQVRAPPMSASLTRLPSTGRRLVSRCMPRFPGANSSAGDVRGDYTITIKQSAGITNPIVAGTKTVTVAAAGVTQTFSQSSRAR